ncbi:MAG: hypothetical protein ACJAVD_001361, partial [Porticoccaceae bacterium]
KDILFSSPFDNLSGKKRSTSIAFFVLYSINISTIVNIDNINNNTFEISKKRGAKKPTTNNMAIVAKK